jgi:hypothetical protein
MTPQLTIKQPLVSITAALFILGAAPVRAMNAGDDEFPIDERPLTEVVATLPAIEIAALVPVSNPVPASVTSPSYLTYSTYLAYSSAPDRGARRQMFDAKSTPLAIALYSMMILDTKSTFDSTAWCPRCVESNPYAAPFIRAGKPAAFAAGIAFDTGVMYVAHRMRHSWNPVMRKIWFVLPAALATGHVFAMHHNYRGLGGK